VARRSGRKTCWSSSVSNGESSFQRFFELLLGQSGGIFEATGFSRALALAIGFPASSLLVNLAIGGLASPLGVLLFLLGAGSILGAATAQRLRRAA
jgi:hypothetical protein